MDGHKNRSTAARKAYLELGVLVFLTSRRLLLNSRKPSTTGNCEQEAWIAVPRLESHLAKIAFRTKVLSTAPQGPDEVLRVLPNVLVVAAVIQTWEDPLAGSLDT